MIISQMVTDRANTIFAKEWAFDWRSDTSPWSFLKGKVMQISTEYLVNGNEFGKHYNCHQIASPTVDFRLPYIHLALTHFKGERSRSFAIRLRKIRKFSYDALRRVIVYAVFLVPHVMI